MCSTKCEMSPEATPSAPHARLTASVTGFRAKAACPSPVQARTGDAEMLLPAFGEPHSPWDAVTLSGSIGFFYTDLNPNRSEV